MRKMDESIISYMEQKDYNKIIDFLKKYERNSLEDESLLFLAYPSDDLICFLVEHGVSVNEQDIVGDTILSYAAGDNNVKLVTKLLAYGAFIDNENVFGEDPFSFACVRGAVDCAKLLYKAGASMRWIKRNWSRRILYSSNNFISREIVLFLEEIRLFELTEGH